MIIAWNTVYNQFPITPSRGKNFCSTTSSVCAGIADNPLRNKMITKNHNHLLTSLNKLSIVDDLNKSSKKYGRNFYFILAATRCFLTYASAKFHDSQEYVFCSSKKRSSRCFKRAPGL